MKYFIEKLKLKLIKLAEYTHLKFFGHEMSDTMRKFLQNLSWSFFGGITAAIIMFLVQIIMARLLGPEEFGKYNIIISLAMGLSTMYLLGNETGSMRFLADKKYKNQESNLLTTTMVIWFVQICAVSIIIIIAGVILRNNFMQFNYLFASIILALFMSVRLLTDGYLRSLHLIKTQSIIKVVEAVVIFGCLAIIIFSNCNLNYKMAVIPVIVGTGTAVLITLKKLLNKFGRFQWSLFFVLLKYNKFIVFSSAGVILISFEKVFIGYVFGAQNVGIYSAHYTVSYLILNILTAIFMNIFWPMAIKEKRSLGAVIKKIDKLFLMAYPFWIGIGSMIIWSAFRLFGDRYSTSKLLIILFITASYLFTFFTISTSILNIDNVKRGAGIIFSCYVLIVGSIFLVPNLEMYLIAQISVYGSFYLLSRYAIINNVFKS